MPNIIESVIPARVLRHKTSGRVVSPYGAVPWHGEVERDEWELIDRGWTWRLHDGTIGLGRKPAATREEALLVMLQVNGS